MSSVPNVSLSRAISPPLALRRRPTLAPVAAAFAIGLASTLYVTLGEVGGVALRPVQLVPLALLPLALTVRHSASVSLGLPLHFLALLWAAYMATRFLIVPPTDAIMAIRAVTCVAAFVAMMQLSICERRPQAALLGLVTGCIVSVAVASANLSMFDKVSRDHRSGRWEGLMPGPNGLADLCGLALVICFAMVIQRRASSSRYTWALCLALCGGGLLASGSRGGLLAAAIGSAVTIWLSAKVQNRRLHLASYLKPAVLLCVVFGAALAAFHDQVPERVWQFVALSSEGRENLENDLRHEIEAAAWEKFRASPIVGGGSETMAFNFGEYASHNSYLHLLSTSGLVSFSLYALLFLLLMHRLAIIAKSHTIPVEMKLWVTPALGGLTFLAIHTFVINLALAAHVWAFFGYCAAVVVQCAVQRKSTSAGLRPHTRRVLSPRRPPRT